MNPQNPVDNVVGFGHGIKWSDGQPTGQEATLIFVTQKLPESMLSSRAIIPRTLGDDTPTDVVAVGHLAAQRVRNGLEPDLVLGRLEMPPEARPPEAGMEPRVPAPAFEPQALRGRMRPCPAGFSIGNVAVTAGTLGSVVYDFEAGATTDPPGPGIGIPARYYVLSNNHVLAASNAAQIGSAIVQPGVADGGSDPADRIAMLSRFIPLQLAPAVPLEQHNNVVDAALGMCEFSDATREIYFGRAPRAWRRKANVSVGDLVRKVGRTTNLTIGRIISMDATVDVGYYGAGTARFRDQIITTSMSAGGDSGSLVTSLDDVAVGLLFAGSSQVTIANHIENVRMLLRVEVAELMA